ncbi:MAG: CDP-alcohol phosphatidyltransferase family protein [Pseudomonadota bacterium]
MSTLTAALSMAYKLNLLVMGEPRHWVHARPAMQFAVMASLGLLAVAAVSSFVFEEPGGAGVLVASLFHAFASGVAWNAMRTSYHHPTIGACNTVTLVRLVLTSVLVGALFDVVQVPWALFALACAAFVLDGADGWLARREGRVSSFGARFDVEVDSVLALALAIHAFQSGTLGVYVLFLGLPRYVFLVAQLPFPWLSKDLPERFARKLVCVVQIATLLFLVSPLADAVGFGVAQGVAVIAVAALIWSFTRDIYWLWTRRG